MTAADTVAHDGVRTFTHDVVVIGGAGHVGLPLAIAFASRGQRTVVYDIGEESVKTVNDGRLPFLEPGAPPVLARALSDDLLHATTDPAVVATARSVVVVIGTPVDEHLNPDPTAIPRALGEVTPYLRDGQLLVLRSTVYPGVTALVERTVAGLGVDVEVAFCPERIAEGKAMEELFSLPQIVSARSERGRSRAAELFGALTDTIVHLEPEEAELAKLFTNTWRYIKFATANQLYMMANDRGLDFDRIRRALGQDYPRAADMPGAGFAAGPCLFKDTMQLAAFSNNTFNLGHAAMLVNEGLPLYLVSRLEARFDLPNATVGILGMAFKGGSDDIRSSLAYKLKRILAFRAGSVLTTDPYVTTDPSLLGLDEVLERSDILVIGAPHSDYRALRPTRPVADVWNLLGNGGGRVTAAVLEPRVSVIIPAYHEGDAITPVLDRLFEAVTLPVEVVVVVDFADDETVAVVEKYAHVRPNLRWVLNTYGRGPANAIRYGIDHARAKVAVVTMSDGSDDPQQIDELTRLVERGVVIAAASRYMPGGQQVGGPLLKGLMSRTAGRSLYAFARVGTRDATNSFKAYSTDFVREVGIDSRAGFEIGLELTAKARRLRRPVAEVPTIWLDRALGASNFQLRKWLPEYLKWYRYAFGHTVPTTPHPEPGVDHV